MVEIRPGVRDDLRSLNDLYNGFVVSSPATFDIVPVSIEARWRWFEEFGGRYRLVVACEGPRVVGYAHSKPFRPKKAYETSIETTVYVAEDHQGRGIGKRLYTALFEALAQEDIHRAYAGVTMPNEASVALHHSFDFERVAYFSEQGRKFGRYWDVAWFEKSL